MASKCVVQRQSRAIATMTRNVISASRSVKHLNSSAITRDVKTLTCRPKPRQDSEFKPMIPFAVSAMAATLAVLHNDDGKLEEELVERFNKNTMGSVAKCDNIISTTSSISKGTSNLSNKRRSGSPKRTTEPRRNVMIHRMRSVRARNLDDKYNVDWKTVLGEGAYGSVHPARLASTGQKVALKKISKRYTSSSSFKTETEALLRIYDNGGHPNISGLRDMYEDYNHFYLILDLVSGGEMFEHLIQYGAYSEADAARLMQEVASALAFTHGVGVVHADLKPENLLLCSKKKSDGTIKIIDFGCAVMNYNDDFELENDAISADVRKKCSPDNAESTKKVNSSTGTTAYWSPERFEKGYVADAKCDMWSLGIILFIMLCGVHPFDLTGCSTDQEIEERIKKDPSPPIGQLTQHLSPSAVDIIQKLMEKDPKKRMAAVEMFSHPWITGETASTSKIIDSDKKLSRFKDLRQKLEAGIFAVLVAHGYPKATISEDKPVSNSEYSGGGDIMKRAFEAFDSEGKGFVSPDDLGRVVGQVTGSQLSSTDSEDMVMATLDAYGNTHNYNGAPNLSLSDFSKLFSRLKHTHFHRGEVIFHAGEKGDAMYFINAGKVEIKTRKGQLVALLRSGDFFGEASLLDENKNRFATAKCATPVDLIKISREEFDRYVASSTSAKNDLKFKWKARSLDYAKNLIRLQTNVKTRILKKGDVVYKEGDEGKSMFLVDKVDGGTLDVLDGDVILHSYVNGDSFGESSLMFTRPRSSTVVCGSDTCKLHEMHGKDFSEMLESSPEVASLVRDMCRKRFFKKAVKQMNVDRKRGFGEDDLIAAFREADVSNSGTLKIDEVRRIMHRMDPNFPESEVVAILKFIDVDGDGSCSLDEFKRIFRVFEDIDNNFDSKL